MSAQFSTEYTLRNMKFAFGQQTSKVKQLADKIAQAISLGEYKIGDLLPSINRLSAHYQVSRDTVFKAFLDLRERGIIDSTPGKGYYVTDKLTHVLLLLDEYSPFKEELYNSFIRRLPSGYKVDLLFHQYSQRLFNTLMQESIGNYNKYIIMNFDNEQFSDILRKIDPNKLLLLDFGKFNKDAYSYICQDFDRGLYLGMLSAIDSLRKYKKLVMVFPKYLKHPQSSKQYFIQFCIDHGFLYEIYESTEECNPQQNVAYLIIKQQNIVEFIKKSRKLNLKCGHDFGILAYNDTPSYEIIDNGITALTIDWREMGEKIAEFVLNDRKYQEYLPTLLRLRGSL